MNRKVREKGEDEEQEDEMVEPVPPKFAANWAQIIRFDRIVMNVAGTYCTVQIAATRW